MDKNMRDKIFGNEKSVGDGFTVPDGYFDDFARRMSEKLPHREELESPVKVLRPTLWTRVRPYVYMAAMFAGVWAMLHLFTTLTNSGADNGLSIENCPELARAASNEQFVEDYVIDDVSTWDVFDSLVADSVDMYALSDSLYNANPDPDSALPYDEDDAVDGIDNN